MKKLIIVLVLMQIALISHSQCATAYKDSAVLAVVVYEHSNYQGRSMILTSDWTVSGSSDPWNDKISSIEVPSGLTVVVYMDWKYQGESMTLTSNWTCQEGPYAWKNDKISSIRVFRTQDAPLPKQKKMPKKP
ncbi:MAG: peptidase inhibitor family I36 protein [Salinivirgaceae bacterium]|nr:peptidase inhibitor family I36 protein [Salinivirgaceae bacterium]